MKKYLATWDANNGRTYNTGVEFSNKKEAIRWARECCRGNVLAGSEGYWRVIIRDERRDSQCCSEYGVVASGTFR